MTSTLLPVVLATVLGVWPPLQVVTITPSGYLPMGSYQKTAVFPRLFSILAHRVKNSTISF